MTRAEAEQILTRRVGAYLAEASMNTTQNGINPALTEPLRWSLAALGYNTASMTAVNDGDLAKVTGARNEALLDLAEVRTMQIVQVNVLSVDVRAGQLDEKRSQMADRLGKMVEERLQACAVRYAGWLALPLTDKAPLRAGLKVL